MELPGDGCTGAGFAAAGDTGTWDTGAGEAGAWGDCGGIGKLELEPAGAVAGGGHAGVSGAGHAAAGAVVASGAGAVQVAVQSGCAGLATSLGTSVEQACSQHASRAV
ncbi:hypothetical protein G7Y31_02510 [Corynebacterium lizhenjunii]|uniref:Uncharacterized protein n=1 Tax=Corynebacterium lizhenjunii TaxID=2709394 RepID=A0A7T0PCD2_9CORY|nr:hypothetical protein [Corynebacterium lizhenjunii]QPK79602.1 hypothetical protein G7Y31_02510 [Corynebacterium lizhenjunii]